MVEYVLFILLFLLFVLHATLEINILKDRVEIHKTNKYYLHLGVKSAKEEAHRIEISSEIFKECLCKSVVLFYLKNL